MYESVIKLKNVRAGFQSLRWRRPRWRLSARTAPVSRLLSGFYVSYRTPRPRYYVRRGASSIELRMYHVADARARASAGVPGELGHTRFTPGRFPKFQATRVRAEGLLNGRFTPAYRYPTSTAVSTGTIHSTVPGKFQAPLEVVQDSQRGAGLRWVVRSRSDGCSLRHPYDWHA